MSAEKQNYNMILLLTIGIIVIVAAAGVYALSMGKNSGGSGPVDYPIPPIGPSPQSNISGNSLVSSNVPISTIQDVYIKALSDGTYDKNTIAVKLGVPVRVHFTADPNAGCGRVFVLYGIAGNPQAISRNGEEQIISFTPDKAGTYTYSCGMRMWGPGKLVVQ